MPGDTPPPWDGLRAAFYLVAAVILLQLLSAIAVVGWCLGFAHVELLAGRLQCDRDGRLAELFATTLTTAIAFAMAFLNRTDRDKR